MPRKVFVKNATRKIRTIKKATIADSFLVVRAGFEPAVRFDPYDGLANRSFRPLRHLTLFLKCDSVWIRTKDLLLRRQLLYPTELRNHWLRTVVACRDGRIRTCDLHIPNVARYRATLHPVLGDFCIISP